VAGARPGLQNWGPNDVTGRSQKMLQHATPFLEAHRQRAESVDPDLPAIADAWFGLPDALKADLLAMVRAFISDRRLE
jgi:hypothetical protein